MILCFCIHICVYVCLSEEVYQLPTLKMLAPSDDETEASFSCLAKDFSPKDFTIKWLKNEEEISNKVEEIKTNVNERKENGTKLYSAASFLTVKSSEWAEDVKFTCEFTGKGESGSKPTTNTSMTYKPSGTVCEYIVTFSLNTIFKCNFNSYGPASISV